MDKEPSYEEISRVYRRLFRALGLLPTSSTLLTNLLTVYFHSMNIVYYTTQLTDGIRMMIRNGGLEIDYVFESILMQGLCSRFLIMSYKRRKLAELTVICEELWQMLKPGEGRVVKKFEKKVRYLMHYFAWTTLSAIIFYIITAQVVRLPPAEVNGTERRILPFRFYVDVQEQPWYELASAFGSIVCFNMTVIIVTIEVTGPFFIMMACGYLKSNNNRLRAIAEASSSGFGKIAAKELSATELVACIKFHQKIMDFCQKIEEFTSALFFVQVMCTVYNISLMLLKLLEQDPDAVKFVPLLLLSLLQLFTCQWIPQFLLNESKATVDAAYSASLVHQEFDPRMNRTLLFVMLRAQRPVQMTAGGFVNLSLETFQRMFTSAISFFTVLRSHR